MSQSESLVSKRSHFHSLSHDQHKWSHSVTLMMPGHEDLVELCDARAHDTREWDLKVNGDVQMISKRVVPDA